jgi:hypothetical protein
MQSFKVGWKTGSRKCSAAELRHSDGLLPKKGNDFERNYSSTQQTQLTILS